MNSQNQEKRTNPSGLLFGSYPAVVATVAPPEKGKLYQVKVRLLGLWDEVPESDLPFAEFLLPLGAKVDAGHAIPVNRGDHVWCDFPYNGDTRYPRITGSHYHAPDYKSNLPSEIYGGEFAPKRAEGEPAHGGFNFTDDVYSRFGLLVQKNQKGNWMIANKNNGTNIEITENGDVIIHSEKSLYQSAVGDKVENVGGTVTVTVGGDKVENVGGAVTVSVEGDCNLNTNGVFAVKAGGAVSFEAGGAFNVKASNADFKLG